MSRSAPMLTRARSALARLAQAALGLRWTSLIRCIPWVLVLGAFEAWGRFSRSDGMDTVALLGLALLGVWVQGRYATSINRIWVERGKPFLSDRLRPWRLDCGLDLRGQPAIAKGHPGAWVGLWASLIGAAVLLGWTAQHWPGDARHLLQGFSGLLSLGALACQWFVLLAATFIACELVAGLTRDRVLGLETRQRTLVAWALFTGGVACMALPLRGCVFAITGMGVAMALVDLVARPRIGILWRPEGASIDDVRSAPRPVWSAAMTSALAAITVALILLASGDRLTATNSPSTAVTGLWGTAFAKLATFAFGVCCSASLARLVIGRWRDPARPCPPRVHVLGATPDQETAIGDALGAAGLVARFRGKPKPCAAMVQLDAHAQPFQMELDREWPMALAAGQFEDARTHDILHRRVRVLCRRGVYSGLRKTLRSVADRSTETGTGFWVEPHLWYVPGIVRDEEVVTWGSSALLYQAAFPGPSRAHLFELLRDLEIDRVFVEDGVGYRRLIRVFAGLFAYHDRFGPLPLDLERMVGEVHGVRMVLHEYTLGSEHGAEDYPEPEYETLGRARLLHVFRDRGGDDVSSLIPDSFDYLPVPQLT